MAVSKWPETLTREQFINALDQFLGWLDDEGKVAVHTFEPSENVAREWVDLMDSIEPHTD